VGNDLWGLAAESTLSGFSGVALLPELSGRICKSLGEDDLSQRLPTNWQAFPGGEIAKVGGEVLLKLSRRAQTVRYGALAWRARGK